MALAKRLFLGFSLTEQQCLAMRGLQQDLKQSSNSLNCDAVDCEAVSSGGLDVTLGNLHLTLAFLGQTDAATEARLCDEITHMPKPRFHQTLDSFVHWPGAGVVCLWGKAEDSALIEMFKASQAIAAKLGLHQSEHTFNPHITLKRKAKVFEMPEWTPAPLTLTPDALHLYHSQSTAFGVQYQILQSWPLGD
ncbi:RNA 2',3'-cyclic phosphodiesterase [Shewanella sp. JM162201]|uniref:RNA 2',3'-cyclic phosphodiesterase n=1 Tax=Shewanella jiangmenensis TaxID=2837387 RepID=A0ABS5UZZ4_9GAMM|nr:RNA 2',3'-cyclic phosphodiesterase [Shewanella jiangmenensis]MBT1443789.1 RNA 2',3'-cyclic phosphodiesterase [Shewanella jiangmenensis]